MDNEERIVLLALSAGEVALLRRALTGLLSGDGRDREDLGQRCHRLLGHLPPEGQPPPVEGTRVSDR